MLSRAHGGHHLPRAVVATITLTLAVSFASPAAEAQADPNIAQAAAARAVWLPAPATDSSRAVVATSMIRNAPQPADAWLGADKAMHFAASFLLTLSTQYLLVNKTDLPEHTALPLAAGTTLSLGLVKEIADSQRERHPLFSWRDIAANTAGVVLAASLILL
jgi:uncharacterized protein YfiM (DUF2279 family)